MSAFSSFRPIRDRWKVYHRYRRACIICLKREDKEAKPSVWKHPRKSEMPIHQPRWILDMYSFNSPLSEEVLAQAPFWIKTSLRSLDLNRWWICRIERSLWNRINCLGDRPLACCLAKKTPMSFYNGANYLLVKGYWSHSGGHNLFFIGSCCASRQTPFSYAQKEVESKKWKQLLPSFVALSRRTLVAPLG